MNLDQLIRDADPARGLDIQIPDPPNFALGPRRGRGRGLGGLVGVAVGVGVAIATVLVVLSFGHRPAQPAAVPSRLPLGASLSQAGPIGVIVRTAQIQTVVPDPESGPPWALRTYLTRSGMTCLQVGRTEAGFVGALGVGGALRNDGRFHPFALSDLGLGTCVPNDANGHAFINIADGRFPANAATEPCLNLPAFITRRHHLPASHCGAVPLRDVYFGLLGPDATSITYVGPKDREITEKTRGPDGAYLIVRPPRAASCSRTALRQAGVPSVCLQSGSGSERGAILSSGEITAVTYRDGQVCRLPIPQGGAVRVGQCPVIGYAPRPGPKYSEAEITSPIEVRKLPARHYCERSGVYRPAALPIPCDAAVPAGYIRRVFTPPRPGSDGTDPGQNLLIYVSWTARAPVRSLSASSYGYTLTYPRGCNTGGEGSSTQALIRAGERITRYFFVPTTRCRGTYSGEVTYIPDLGPDGQNNNLLGVPSSGRGVLLVGRFTFTVP